MMIKKEDLEFFPIFFFEIAVKPDKEKNQFYLYPVSLIFYK